MSKEEKYLSNLYSSLLDCRSNPELIFKLSELKDYIEKLYKEVKDERVKKIITSLIEDIQGFEDLECSFKILVEELKKLISLI